MAQEKPGQTLQATALVHEAWLRLAGADEQKAWNRRGHFFGAAAEAMRRILVESARRKARLRHGGELEKVSVDQIEIAATLSDDRLVQVSEALDELEREAMRWWLRPSPDSTLRSGNYSKRRDSTRASLPNASPTSAASK